MNKSMFDNMVRKPIKNESLTDKVYEIIEENIINMTLPPGSRLSEDNIAKSLDVSRSPVREAMLRLKHVGLVNKNRTGWIVPDITKEAIVNNYEIWEMIESFAAPLACKIATEEDFLKIEDILNKMEYCAKKDSLNEYRELNYVFHYSLVLPCANKSIVEMHKNVLNRVHWCYNYSLTWASDIEVSSSNHKKIFNAYKNREDAVLEKLVKEHIDNACTRFQKGISKKESSNSPINTSWI